MIYRNYVNKENTEHAIVAVLGLLIVIRREAITEPVNDCTKDTKTRLCFSFGIAIHKLYRYMIFITSYKIGHWAVESRQMFG